MKRWLSLALLALPTLVAGQTTFGSLRRAPDGRAFVFPSKKKDTTYLTVGGQFVRLTAARLPALPYALSVKVDVNEGEGYFNAQGLPIVEGTRWRYSIDAGKTWRDAAWAWKLPLGTYTVRVETTRPGFAVGYAERQFTIPGKQTGGTPPGQVPTTPNLPTNPGKTEPGGAPPAKPRPDETRIEFYPTDVGAFPQPAASRLRRIPRLVLPPLARTVDPDFGSIPPFTAPAGLLTIYQDAGPVSEAKTRGWQVFKQHGLPGSENAIMLYNNIFEEPTTKFRQGIGDAAEIPDLIRRAIGAVGGWRGPDGRVPRIIAVDWEIGVQPGQEHQFYTNRGAVIQALRREFPGSLVGHYGGMPMPAYDGPTDFHMVGDYILPNPWDGTRHFDACQNPALWTRAVDAYGEWAYQKYNEARKALRTRSEGKGLMAFWNQFKDGCEVEGQMAVRDDVAEGALLIGILGGMEGVWPWNAHCGAPPCERMPQVLTGTRALNAALWRLSRPEIRDLLDGNQTYFFPDVSVNGRDFRSQPKEFNNSGGGFARPVYASLRAPNGHEVFAAYDWPDELPVAVGIRNRGQVAVVAVLPREQNPVAVRQIWLRDGDFSETINLKGRLAELFVSE